MRISDWSSDVCSSDLMVLDATESRVVAVLDWELSTLGDPIADLTYLLMHWTTPDDERNSLAGLDLAALGIPRMEDMLDRYLAATGDRLGAPIEWYLAYNLFQIGRASCRDRVCQYVLISLVAVSLKKKKKT